MRDSHLGRHVPQEGVYVRILAAALDAHRYSGGYRETPTDNGGAQHAVFGERQRHRVARQNRGFQLGLGNALQQAMTMRAPGSQHPIVWVDALENVNEFFVGRARSEEHTSELR